MVSGFIDKNDPSGGFPNLDPNSPSVYRTYNIVTNVSKDGEKVLTTITRIRTVNTYDANGNMISNTTKDVFSEADGTLTISTDESGTLYSFADGSIKVPKPNTYEKLKNDVIQYNSKNRDTYDLDFSSKIADASNYGVDEILGKIPGLNQVRALLDITTNSKTKFTASDVNKRYYLSGQYNYEIYYFYIHPQSGIVVIGQRDVGGDQYVPLIGHVK